jgi:hypothetical protein
MKKNSLGKNFSLIFLLILICCSSFVLLKKEKPTFYIIGDSTVRNGDGSGRNGQWGWGDFIADYFDSTKIKIQNLAIGGRSSRTFITEGRWDKILAALKKGDYVIMQFGHNDAGPLDDTARARGTIRGIGEESSEIYNPIMKKQEVVHTYGWYMRKYINDTKAKGAIPIDLNNLVALQYEAMGAEAIKHFFPSDHTHTNLEGAKLNASFVMKEIQRIKPGKLKKYLKKPV